MNFIEVVSTITKCLLLYPASISVYNVMAFLIAIPEISTQQVKLLAEQPEKVNENLASALDKTYYLSHSDVIPANTIIIVDYLTESFNFESVPVTSHLIILHTMGDFYHPKLQIDIEKIYTLSLVNPGPSLSHRTIEILDPTAKNFKIQKYLYGKPGSVIITDNYNLTGRNITGCHFVNVPAYQDYRQVLRATYNRKLYDTNLIEYVCFFYVDVTNPEDIQKYEMLATEIIDQQTKYRQLLQAADKLMFNESGLVIYTEPSLNLNPS